MRLPLILSAVLSFGLMTLPAMAQLAVPAAAQAQGQAPVASDPYTVAGVQIDMPVASAQEARDAALLAAERQALQKLRDQLAAAGTPTTIPEPSDSQLVKLVQNFEVANERISAKRYSGSFTIRFRPHAVGQSVADTPAAAPLAATPSSLTALYRFTSLSEWTAVQRRLLQSGLVQAVELKAIGRGYVRAALAYGGPVDALAHALASQGLTLQRMAGGWVLTGA